MNETEILKQRIEHLEYLINQFVKPDSYFFKERATKIGLNANSLMGFYGLTPIIQPSSTGEGSGANLSGTTVGHTSTFTGNDGSTAYTISDVVKHLKNLGILKK